MPESSNNKPDSTDTIVTTSEDTQIILTVKDFGNYTDPNNNPFTSVKITTLETAGALKYLESPGNWVDVHKDDIITVADIKDGKLRFEPGANDFGDPYTHFNFKVIDSTNDISSHDYQLTVKVTPVNDAPTVIAPSSFTVTEDVAGNLTFTGIPFADVDNTSLTVTLSITDGTISASTSNKVTVIGTALARTFSGTVTDLNDYFTHAGNITYQTALNNNTIRTLQIVVKDDASLTSSATSKVNITPVNDPHTGGVTITGTATQNQTLTVWVRSTTSGRQMAKILLERQAARLFLARRRLVIRSR